jgi:RNA polymerase sigma-70 factor (ECF subfamily)
MGKRDDITLNQLLQQGDENAFAEFYESLWEPLYIYVARIIHDKDEAMDIVQESFIALWKQRISLKNVDSVQAYLFTIARFKALRYIRLNIKKRDFQSSMLQFFEHHTPTVDEVMITDDLQKTIDEGVQCLPGKMQEIFKLSRNEHLTYKEIASQLSISDKTVKKQINNALRILRLKVESSFLLLSLCASLLADNNSQ